MMTRLSALENIIKSIRTQPLEDAERLFHRIRATDGSESPAKFAVDGTTNNDADSDLFDANFSSFMTSASPSADPDLDSVSNTQSPSFSGKSLTNNGVFPSRPSSERKNSTLPEIALPDRTIISNAIEAFFTFSFQPFHVFTQEEAGHLLRTVYFRDLAPSQEYDQAATACLAAIAAVGARYHRAKLSKDTSQGLYDVARYYFDKTIDTRPLDAIRCCVLLAMYNFMSRPTVALVYVETGLSMARRQGLYARDPRDTTLTIQRWTEYRKAWRTLLCLSSWIPFTPGFNEDHDDPISRIPVLAATDLGPQLDDIDVLQSEMAKVSLLKADLLRVRLALPLIDIPIIQSANHDLQSWYSQIPESMYLHNVAQPNYGEGVQACICYIHLLHLDAIMLLARRAMSQFVRVHGFRNPDELPWTSLDQALVNQAAEGVVAASHASRILALLGGSDQVHDITWLIMNQIYASCILLLQSTAQKQLCQLPESRWSEDLEQATICLAILETCGQSDALAAQLHAQLNVLHQQILEFSSHTSSAPAILSSSISWSENAYLVTSPHGANPRLVQLSATLLNLVSKPFNKISEGLVKMEGRPNGREVYEMNNVERKRSSPQNSLASDGSSHPMPHSSLSRKLEDWNFESTLPFRVDSQRTAVFPGNEAVPALNGDMAPSPRASTHFEGTKGVKRTKPGPH
ncbi:hypothetical protein F5X68DRAFT_251338 [Plectosphaerella plurivora]|uniref:Transcription factor domain-containing protein n=1 Tax=Plectosphaerella plurivora TaxID=936078 RepID=A0A9P9A4X8_9PEZI|nr:hypothetical protein F5X68DRAFT_251338 [Plectosphaerella plurivora]